MDFHLDGLVTGEVLLVRIKNASHAHFLTRAHVLIVQHKSSFLQGSVRIGIAFRLGVGRLVVSLGIFTVVKSRNSNIGCISCGGSHRCSLFHAIHFYNLGVFRRAGLIEISNRRFFPGVAHHSKTCHLDLRFGNATIQGANPHSGILSFTKNRTIVATRCRNNRIILVQRNTPLAPTILQFFKMQKVRIGKVYTIADKTNVHIQRAILVNVFRIVSAFTRVVFRTVNIYGRIAIIVQIVIEVIQSNIVRGCIRIQSILFMRNTFCRTAVPINAGFIITRFVIQTSIMQSNGRTDVIFTVILSVRSIAIDRQVFAYKTQVKIDGTHITASDHFNVLHIAHVLIIGAIGTHDTAPGIAGQVVVRT